MHNKKIYHYQQRENLLKSSKEENNCSNNTENSINAKIAHSDRNI